ncbi:MAG: hypothetical protein MJA83_15545 [Gammaproteobacteria bacterium]|nr:hypothetical protein [Gammaproteobacteria bacterium]
MKTAALLVLSMGTAAGDDPRAVENLRLEQPDEELLLFLGTWEANDGEWIDPMHFADEGIEVVEQDLAEEAGDDR